MYVGVSEERGDQRGAQFSGVEDMLQRYAVWLKNRLNALLPSRWPSSGPQAKEAVLKEFARLAGKE